jgi:hypothetical protein
MRNLLTILTGVLAASSASAQTVQLPVIEQIGVRTSVMVPDRGGVYLGGVKRLREGAGFSTPFGLGSSIGREVSNVGMSAHVYISDLHEMDDLILNSPDHGYSFGVRFVDPGPYGGRFSDFSMRRSPSFVQSVGRVSRRPASGYPTLLSSRTSGLASRSQAKTAPKAPKPGTKSSLNANRSLRLGKKAEADGKEGLAILHYRTAAQLGSVAARERLAFLGDTVKVKALASK